MNDAIIAAEGLTKHFIVGGILSNGKRRVRAVESIDLSIRHGETIGVVGESGCGKSTLGRLLIRLCDPTSGRVWFRGEEITGLRGKGLRKLRTRMQIVFQDPVSSLNPRHRVADILAAPFQIHSHAGSTEIAGRVADLMERVGLDIDARRKFPHEFSGGQRQRIGIARAIALQPDVIVCDEPVSALDVSVQAQIINLLKDLNEKTGVAMLFISHDLAVVENISSRVAVMYLGRIVEIAPRDDLFDSPAHPYTEALIRSVPRPSPSRSKSRRQLLSGEMPSPVNPPSGCTFHPRCPIAREMCRTVAPELTGRADGRHVACHFR